MPVSRHVLVVDDDIDIRTLLELALAPAGFTVFTAVNGAEALRAARLARPSVIVLDLMMPVMDGFEFRRHQQLDPALSDIPVIVTSAAHNLVQRARALGAVAVLVKPFDLDAMLQAVTEATQPT